MKVGPPEKTLRLLKQQTAGTSQVNGGAKLAPCPVSVNLSNCDVLATFEHFGNLLRS